jgi:hypothetical protein
MTQELFDVIVAGRLRVSGWPLEEIPLGPGYWLSSTRAAGPALYAVPRADGGYEWAPWEEAARRGWSERYGRREYQGAELPRRFLVLYFPPARRSWRTPWRRVQPAPLRLEACRNPGEAEWLAERLLPRRQLGFHWTAEPELLAVWGWDDREVGYHEECDAECGCDDPLPGREFVLIAEFEREELALRPDVRLEREAWMARLDAERAMALTDDCVGGCRPACGHCSASYEEIEAAWAWLSTHRREVRAWRRQRRRRGRPQPVDRRLWTMPAPTTSDQPGGRLVQTAPPPHGRDPE